MKSGPWMLANLRALGCSGTPAGRRRCHAYLQD